MPQVAQPGVVSQDKGKAEAVELPILATAPANNEDEFFTQVFKLLMLPLRLTQSRQTPSDSMNN